MSSIRVPYNGANCIVVGGKCYSLVGVTTGTIDTLAVKKEFDDCADCLDYIDPDKECSPVIPKYPPSSLYSEPSISEPSLSACPSPQTSSQSSGSSYDEYSSSAGA